MLFAAELPFAFYALAAFVFGLLVGSFLNVVIWRVPRGESIAFPGSHCGSCGAAVRSYDNIPLLSYAMLGGKCRACRAKISFIYPAVELLTGLLFLAVIYRSGPTWVAVAEMIFVAVLVSLTFIDAQHQLLPNVITYPAFLFATAAVTMTPWITGQALPSAHFESSLTPASMAAAGALILSLAVPTFWLIDYLDDVLFGKYFATDEDITEAESDAGSDALSLNQHRRMLQVTMVLGIIVAGVWAVKGWQAGRPEAAAMESALYVTAWVHLWNALLGALIGGGIIWLLRAAYFLTRGIEGMGLGDVKLMAVIGAFLGWQQSILVIVIGSLAGSVVGVILARKSEDGMRTALPFGVFLGPAAILALFFGQSVVMWYAGNFR